METPIYNVQGKKTGDITLPENIFGVAWNDSLMHQVVTSMQDNARTPVAHVKDRGAVSGGGKKPWRQKGTGRARHGSNRSPIWKGGGVTHGPTKLKNYSRAIPKKMRAKALFMALSRKFKAGEIIFVDTFGFDAPKTSMAVRAFAALSKVEGFEKLSGKNAKRRNMALIALSDPQDASVKSFRNIGSTTVSAVRDMNPVSVLKHKYLVIENPEAAVAIVANRTVSKGSVNTAAGSVVTGKRSTVKRVAKEKKVVAKKASAKTAAKTK